MITKGRFAPSPTGRMHLGNIYAAIQSWLSAKSRGGKWVLRIEDIDRERSKQVWADWIMRDLEWLGLEWDEGPYYQSERGDIYMDHLEKLNRKGLIYPCHCTRAEVMATQAPHESDGRIVYAGTCKPENIAPIPNLSSLGEKVRIAVPNREICFCDRNFGQQSVNLASHCGDFVLRRADGAWAYQLAVVVDDALMGITEVVRGEDLLLSTAQQIFLFETFGYDIPEYAHIPLLRNEAGQRLSKRDRSMDMEVIRTLPLHSSNHNDTSLTPLDKVLKMIDMVKSGEWKQ